MLKKFKAKFYNNVSDLPYHSITFSTTQIKEVLQLWASTRFLTLGIVAKQFDRQRTTSDLSKEIC